MSDAFFETDDGQRIPLTDGAAIGRLPSRDVTFDVPAMSRTHAEVRVRTGSWWLADLGSKNGTYVNGAAVTDEPVALVDGDTVVFAGAISVVFSTGLEPPL